MTERDLIHRGWELWDVPWRAPMMVVPEDFDPAVLNDLRPGPVTFVDHIDRPQLFSRLFGTGA